MDVSGEVREPGVQVSVIVAVKNGAATLEQCIESVLAQDGCSAELIIVDAMSTDGTESIVASYDSRVTHYIREPDSSVSEAWNKAVRVASGRWCIFLGADDYFTHVGALARLLECAKVHGATPTLVFGGVLRVGGLEEHVVHPDPPDPRRFLLSGRMLPHQGILHHLDSLRAVGGFDPEKRISADFAAVLRMLELGPAIRCTAVITAMRTGGLSSRSDLRAMRHREVAGTLSLHRGRVYGRVHYLRKRSTQAVALLVERLLLRVLGEQRGIHTVRSLRRRLRTSPELLVEHPRHGERT